MENNIQTSQTSEQKEQPGLLSRIMMLFSEPSKLFGILTGKTAWLIPLIIIGILGTAIYYQTRPIFAEGMEATLMEMLQTYEDKIPAAQYSQMIEDATKQFDEARENKFLWYSPLLSSGVPLVIWMIISVIGMLAGNFIFGGKAGFWLIFNVVTYAALIGLLGDVIRDSMMLSKGTTDVFTGLGLLKPIIGGNTFLFYLFRQIDIFSIWRIIVTCIGLGVVYKMSAKKFGYVIFGIWVVFIVIVAALNASFFAGGIIY
ncbi:MAG: hypothetical protein ABIJ45_08860 [Candidatus Zixiibacteriota bacterium]